MKYNNGKINSKINNKKFNMNEVKPAMYEKWDDKKHQKCDCSTPLIWSALSTICLRCGKSCDDEVRL